MAQPCSAVTYMEVNLQTWGNPGSGENRNSNFDSSQITHITFLEYNKETALQITIIAFYGHS